MSETGWEAICDRRYRDHIHLAVEIPPQIAVAKFVAQVKGASSHFVNHEVQPGFGFYWQSEYGALTFGKSHMDLVTNYILNQRQHHNDNTVYRSMEQS
jgi:putative transposase